MNIISKISTKTIFGTVNAKTPSDEGVVKANGALYRVFGMASDVKHGESQYGPYTEFRGQFRALNLHTGEEYQAGKCFLPVVASNLLEGILTSVDAAQFAFDIGVKEADTQIGYEYTVTPLIAADEADPLTALANSLPDVPKLAAPKKAANAKK